MAEGVQERGRHGVRRADHDVVDVLGTDTRTRARSLRRVRAEFSQYNCRRAGPAAYATGEDAEHALVQRHDRVVGPLDAVHNLVLVHAGDDVRALLARRLEELDVAHVCASEPDSAAVTPLGR